MGRYSELHGKYRKAVEGIRKGVEVKIVLEGEDVNVGRFVSYADVVSKYNLPKEAKAVTQVIKQLQKFDPRIKFAGSRTGSKGLSGFFYIPSDAPKMKFVNLSKRVNKKLTTDEQHIHRFFILLKADWFYGDDYDVRRSNYAATAFRKAFIRLFDELFLPRSEFLADIFKRDRTTIVGVRNRIAQNDWYKEDQAHYDKIKKIYDKWKENDIFMPKPIEF